MDKYRQTLFNYDCCKNTSFLYELALERGKNRGWYPTDWKLGDYINHIFSIKSPKPQQ